MAYARVRQCCKSSPDVDVMFYHAELAAVMSDRAAVLRSRLREIEASTALQPPLDARQLTP